MIIVHYNLSCGILPALCGVDTAGFMDIRVYSYRDKDRIHKNVGFKDVFDLPKEFKLCISCADIALEKRYNESVETYS